MKKLKVQVKQHHIDNGVPGSASKCMLALAVAEAADARCSVCIYTLAIIKTEAETKRNRYMHYDIPLEARLKMIDFDRGHKVEPFEFTLGTGSESVERKNQ